MRFPRYLSSLNKTQISDFRCLNRTGLRVKKGRAIDGSPRKVSSSKNELENDAQTHLNYAASQLDVFVFCKTRTLCAGVADIFVRQVTTSFDAEARIWVIQDVEGLAAQLHGQVFKHLDVLEDAHIQLVEFRSTQGIARRIAKRRAEDPR